MNHGEVIEPLERRTLFNALVFSQPTSFAAGKNPSSLITADLTNNGKIDVVTADFSSASIAVLMGNGNGTFAAPVLYPVGNSPESIAVGDFNNDGIPDIVTANEGANTISVLIGNGDGGFAAQLTYPVGLRPQAVAVADLNGDGLPDIVTANEGSNNISVLLNAGNGTFEPAVEYAAGIAPVALALGDLTSDGHLDVVTANPFTNSVHVLENNGAGVFNIIGAYGTAQGPRSVALTDVNSDGRLDIITGDLDNEAISVLLGNGNGTFRPTTNYIAGVRPVSIIVADMNGDGRLDVVTADNFDNGVAVLLRTGLGGFAPVKSFNAGNGPVAAVAADLNGDGKPDIIVADFNNGTVSVLLNQTVFVPLIPTTAVLSASQTPVEVGNGLVLSTQITKTGSSLNLPTGVVQYFIGETVIGIGHVNSSGVAAISINTLTVGTYTITAHYGGDSIFAGSDTDAISELVITAAQATPFVTPTICALHIPTNYVPLSLCYADVSVYDAGAGRAKGAVGVQLYASTSTTFDSTAFPVAIEGTGQVGLNLAGNQTRTVAIPFHMPADIEPGNYTIFAALVPLTGLTAGQVSTVPAVGLNDKQAVLQFGAVSTQKGYELTRTLPNGDTYTLALSGHGYGTVTENPDGGISITLYNTSGNTLVRIVSSTGVTLDGLIANGFIGSIYAPTTNFNGLIGLGDGARRLTLGNGSNSQIYIGGGGAKVLAFGGMSDVYLYCSDPIHQLDVAGYTDQSNDIVTTPWIENLYSAGDFGANLVLGGSLGVLRRSLNDAVIRGAMLSSTWNIAANIGSIVAGGVDAGWSGSVRGSIGSFVDLGDFAGQLAVRTISQLQIDGNLIDADILAGANFGVDARLGDADDSFTSGILTSLRVQGSVTNSIIAAGLKPDGTTLVPPAATLLPHSLIQSIKILGTLDTGSLFESVGLPKLVSVDGNTITTAGNSHFVS